jgi:predicted dehydrogenase
MTAICRVAMIGCGGMARHHIRQMLKQSSTTEITVLCEPSVEQLAATNELFTAAGLVPPPNEPDLEKMLRDYPLDAAFIITPHAYHFNQTRACLEAGLDVLLEKPMVMNAAEARDLIAVQRRTGRLLVVAFPGSLSPQIRKAVEMLRSGELGKLISIDGLCWQSWGEYTVNTWRQEPAISGGGFLFDTGAHLLNTVVDLAGEEFAEVAAWCDNNDRPVETTSVAMGRLRSGVMVTLHACGEAIPSCASEIRLFTSKAILRTGIWGERLEIQPAGKNEFEPVPVTDSLGVWEQFLAVRAGTIPNPCPPEVGLRMNLLYDAIKCSALENGKMVKC